jgi:hypothetical protein
MCNLADSLRRREFDRLQRLGRAACGLGQAAFRQERFIVPAEKRVLNFAFPVGRIGNPSYDRWSPRRGSAKKEYVTIRANSKPRDPQKKSMPDPNAPSERCQKATTLECGRLWP